MTISDYDLFIIQYSIYQYSIIVLRVSFHLSLRANMKIGAIFSTDVSMISQRLTSNHDYKMSRSALVRFSHVSFTIVPISFVFFSRRRGSS